MWVLNLLKTFFAETLPTISNDLTYKGLEYETTFINISTLLEIQGVFPDGSNTPEIISSLEPFLGFLG